MKEKLSEFLRSKGKELVLGFSIGVQNCNVILADSLDGRGIWIAQWDTGSLGDWPTEADGFSADQLRNRPR